MIENVMLGVIGNGRHEFLSQAVESLKKNVQYPWRIKVMINDTGDMQYAQYLEETYPDWHVVSHQKNKGLSGSIMSLWSAARLLDVDYVFHVEEDFTFPQPIDIGLLKEILVADSTLAQIALKRQPCNEAEAAAGGFMQQNPGSYATHWYHSRPASIYTDFKEPYRYEYVTHRNFFTLNPCLYPMKTIDIGWQQGWGEREFSERLFAKDEVYCGFLGGIHDSHIVNHIGNYRGNNWFV